MEKNGTSLLLRPCHQSEVGSGGSSPSRTVQSPFQFVLRVPFGRVKRNIDQKEIINAIEMLLKPGGRDDYGPDFMFFEWLLSPQENFKNRHHEC
jgi:hypothetical protein